jgi:CCR4-NOT transcription complex subunit 2
LGQIGSAVSNAFGGLGGAQLQQHHLQQHQPQGQQQGVSAQDQERASTLWQPTDFPALIKDGRVPAQALANGSISSIGSGADLYNSMVMQGKQQTQQGADFSIQNEEDFPALGGPGADDQKGARAGVQRPGSLSDGPSSLNEQALLKSLEGTSAEQRSGLARMYQQQQQQRRADQREGQVGGLSQQLAPQAGAAAPDRFGLLGLLSVIRMESPDLTTLALGTDLTTLGLHLNSPENVYKTFQSPWVDAPLRPEPEFRVPACYLHNPPRLQPGYFSKFQAETLFFIFYSMPSDEAQLFAADELAHRGWWFHKEQKTWLMRIPNMEPVLKTDRFERGTFLVFDTTIWETVKKENMQVNYEHLERPPNLPRPVSQSPSVAALK